MSIARSAQVRRTGGGVIQPVTVLTKILADGSIGNINAAVGRPIENPDN